MPARLRGGGLVVGLGSNWAKGLHNALGAGCAASIDSQTELFAGVCGHAPTDVVLTWARAKSLLGIGRRR